MTPYELLENHWLDSTYGILKKFSIESNAIESEHHTYESDVDAITFLLQQEKITEEAIKVCHSIYANNRLEKKYTGEYRDCPVYVGSYVPPSKDMVPELMHNLVLYTPGMNSYVLHCKFEKIHPFIDLNGRVGRALWAWQAIINEGYLLDRLFLHEFYYQSLIHYERLQKR